MSKTKGKVFFFVTLRTYHNNLQVTGKKQNLNIYIFSLELAKAVNWPGSKNFINLI